MPDKKSGFLEVSERLKNVLGLTSDSQLAKRLGLLQGTWSMNKTRGSLPRKAIDNLLEYENLNPEYIYNGTGRVHAEDDHHTWLSGFQQRLNQCLSLESQQALLVREGHTKTTLKAIVSGKQDPSYTLVRDIRRVLRVDLNWLISGDAVEAPNAEEQTLLSLYRKADAVRQKAILMTMITVDDLSPKQTKNKQKAGRNAVQIVGDVSGVIQAGSNNEHGQQPKNKAKRG